MIEFVVAIITFLINLLPIFIIGYIFYANCYKKCPPNTAIVVYGKTENSMEPTIITNGGIFVIPLIQDYAVLSLKTMTINIDTADNTSKDLGLITKDNNYVGLKGKFRVAISDKPALLSNAVKIFLGIPQKDIETLAQDVILGAIRLITATMTMEEIYDNQFNKKYIETELSKIGMELISMQIEEITDSSGYNESKERETSAENSFNQEFKEIAQKEIEKQDITEIQNMPDVPETQNLQELQEVSEEESLENKIEEVQKTFELQNDTQTDVNDIFASTRKYFEQNGNT